MIKGMIVFVDESGIHKRVDHSAFSVVFVCIDDYESVEKAVLEIEERYRLNPFHWSDLPWKLREAFLCDIAKLPFSAKIAIVRNPITPAKTLEWALQHLLVERDIKKLYIDGKKPRWVERKLKKVLRDKGISVRKLRTARHDSIPGLRIADAIAGLARTFHDNPKGRAKPLWDMMNKKITTRLAGGQTGG